MGKESTKRSTTESAVSTSGSGAGSLLNEHYSIGSPELQEILSGLDAKVAGIVAGLNESDPNTAEIVRVFKEKDRALRQVHDELRQRTAEFEEANAVLKKEIGERWKVERVNRELLHDAQERLKELTCLHEVAESVRRQEDLGAMFEDIVRLIPPAFQHPDVTRARICFGDTEHLSEGFEESTWKMEGDVVVEGKSCGTLEVHYLAECPDLEQTPFLDEERRLVLTLSRTIAQAVERHRTDKRLKTEITERKRSEKILHRYECIVSSSRDMLALLDENIVYLAANEAYLRAIGVKPEELIGHTPADLFGNEFFDAVIRPNADRCLAGEEVHYEGWFEFPALGRRYMDIAYSPYRDVNDEVQGLVVCARNATDRRRVEETLARRSDELARSNADLDDFAYIASHDLKEPLRGIRNYSTFLLEDYRDKLDDEGRSKLETLVRLTGHMDALINSLLYFSRVGRVDLAVGDIDLNNVLAVVLDSLHISLAEHGIEVRIPKELPTARCDGARIGEVFRNLITNAMKYNDKPRKWIEIGFREERAEREGGEREEAHGNPIVYYVRDNGIGIRERQIDSVFRMFKRLHGRDKFGGGTGAGLTVVKKIVERHGGRIWVESDYGKGTTFYFTLQAER